jgi:hypothetical protein
MIAKGTTHNNGIRLARYMTTGKEGERAELWQLTGFAADDIRDAFRSVHVMAAATHCEKPFLHIQVRNPEGENLSREQWLRVANRIESKLGLTGQPRAIAFHTDLRTGHEHVHLALSRIDGETLTARPLPFSKMRLKEVCRELEITLGLTRVKNERDDQLMAPTRSEFEQARRLGVNIRKVRQIIRDCFEHSDNGRSFDAALADQGFILAKGDRRDFVVIDHERGIHALGKRLLGVTVEQSRDHLADLSREKLLTVAQARSLISERQHGKEGTMPEPAGDRERAETTCQSALAKAAVAVCGSGRSQSVKRKRIGESKRRANVTDEGRSLRRTLYREAGRTNKLNRKGAGRTGGRGAGGTRIRSSPPTTVGKDSIAGRGRGSVRSHNPRSVLLPRVHSPPAAARPEDMRSRIQEERDFRRFMYQLLRDGRKHRDEDKPARLIAERPSTMWELYQWFKARGELAYFYANIAPKP